MSGLVAYVPRPSPVHALHPATKGAYFACLAVAAILFPEVGFLVLLLCAALLVLARARVLLEAWASMRRAVLPIALLILVVQSLVYPGPTEILFRLGPVGIKEQGLLFGAVTSLRLLVLVSAFLPLLLATHPNSLMAALEQRGVSPQVSYIVLGTIQIIPQIQLRAAAIIDAQRSRGLCTHGSPWARFRSLLALVGPLLTGSLLEVEQRALALEARGMMLPGRKVRLLEVPDSPQDRRARRALLAVLLSLVVLRGVLWISRS